MKKLFSLVVTIALFSCNRDWYGTYNTNYSKDKTAYFELKLNQDNTVEKTEIHTISDVARGKYLVENNQIVCFFDSSKNKFPPDTLRFRKKGRKLYFLNRGNGKIFLMKQ